MADKVIVTNEGALRQKYGAAGLRAVKAAVARLVAADRSRGLSTVLVALDGAAGMKRLKAPQVTSVANCRQNKKAIDAVWAATSPDYLMILGSTDVVPHQDLKNPVHQAGEDDDVLAPGDVPYACDAPYSNDITKFIGPTRVVSRLPDVTGARDPAPLVALIDAAAAWTPWAAGDAARYFGLSAAVWRGSTALSLENVFGNADALNLAPPKGPVFPASVLGARAHFINCHGGDSDPAFYGQQGQTFPQALTSRSTEGKIAAGTVAAVECCYGAQLYPAGVLQLPVPICQSYLAQGSYGYFGSTTIAYGPADGNGAADLIAQYFLLKVLEGSSIGMAALSARQQFVAQTGQMDPVDLKTLAQFCLYGDPSIHPVAVTSPTSAPKGIHLSVLDAMGRRERRAKMTDTGNLLLAAKPTAGTVQRGATTTRLVRSVLAGLSRSAGVPSGHFVSFAVRRKAGTQESKTLAHPERYHVLVAKARRQRASLVQNIAIVAKEVSQRVVAYRVYYSR
jgi:hypothetical protein